jgi:putative aminopeptidase FrvX
MQREQLLGVARALCEQPTAPFHEDAVRDEIVAQLRDCPHVSLEHDAVGNTIARYRRGSTAEPSWAFAAHMDHPGWVRTPENDWRFLGSVAERFLLDARKREFGDFAMWDLPEFELKEDRIYSRACDDLLGCAEIVCLFRELEAENTEAHCLGLFTRAEEIGFWGAIQLARSGILPRDVTILSLETSAPRGGAEIGGGPIVRVGDRLSVFDSAATARVMKTATVNEIPVQRCLLDGGSCEATAYQLYGYRSAAASIALGNYHNCAPDGSIQCEFVSVDDYANMIRLCVSLARGGVGDATETLRSTLETKAASHQSYFRPLNRTK